MTGSRLLMKGDRAPDERIRPPDDEIRPPDEGITPGISLSSHLDKLGMRSSETAQEFFDNVRVPQRNRIGHEGAGFMMQMLQFQEERLFGAANMIKGLEYCIDSTIEYCKERKTFGNALI